MTGTTTIIEVFLHSLNCCFSGDVIERGVAIPPARLPAVFFFFYGRSQIQGAYFDFAGQWTQTHTFKGTATGDVVTDAVLRDFKNFVLRRQKEVTFLVLVCFFYEYIFFSLFSIAHD